jgi:hypothetical protein
MPQNKIMVNSTYCNYCMPDGRLDSASLKYSSFPKVRREIPRQLRGGYCAEKVECSLLHRIFIVSREI